MTLSAMAKRGLLVATIALALVTFTGLESSRNRKSFAQSLLRDVLRQHPEVRVIELAVVSGDGCVTIAATDASDIGHRCSATERATMQSDEPYVEHPDEDDPAYVISEALHDASGRVVGLVITDIVVREPGGNREAALARARGVRRVLEARIPSVASLKAGTFAVADASR
jgi:hypothetical protein